MLAIEIGGTKLQLVVGDAAGNILHRKRLTVNPAEGAPGIRRQIEQSLPDLLHAFPIHRVAVGFGGPVDWRRGRIACSHQIEGWSDFDLAGWLQPLVGVPVFVENDSNLAALGEATRGAGAGFNPVFYFNLGSGVGGGLVVNGAVYHGAPPGEVEFGHLRLDRSWATVESMCSGWAVDARIRALQTTEPASALCQLIGNVPGGEAKHLAAAVAQGDSAARRVLQTTAEDVAFALSHAVHLFHPEIIILGGGLAGVGEPLRAAIAAALPQFVMEVFRPGPCVALAALGEDAVPVGALELAKASSLKSN
jgi:glucokinase